MQFNAGLLMIADRYLKIDEADYIIKYFSCQNKYILLKEQNAEPRLYSDISCNSKNRKLFGSGQRAFSHSACGLISNTQT